MNYIGSKQKLAPWIFECIRQTYENDNQKLDQAIFADIFAGTGQVARFFKDKVGKVISNDLESYSYILNSHYIKNSSIIDNPFNLINQTPQEGLFYKKFSPNKIKNDINCKRMYFTTDNAKIIDSIRMQIESLKESNKVSEQQYIWLLASLIESTDIVANTTSVYGAFLKKFKKAALKPLPFKAVDYKITNQNNEVYQKDANQLITEISGDILYLDPPYNQRQYGANYHVLNRLIEYTDFTSDKKTGLSEYNKSNYCKRNVVESEFESLIKNAKFKYIFISYNNEGLILEEKFKSIIETYGEHKIFKKEYKRFKADKNRGEVPESTFEHLHVLIKH